MIQINHFHETKLNPLGFVLLNLSDPQRKEGTTSIKKGGEKQKKKMKEWEFKGDTR